MSENRCNLFVLPPPLMAGVTLCQAAQRLLASHQANMKNLLGNKRDVTGAGWEGGRIAVNTSSNDLHNIQPYSSLTCLPTLGVTVLINRYSVNL